MSLLKDCVFGGKLGAVTMPSGCCCSALDEHVICPSFHRCIFKRRSQRSVWLAGWRLGVGGASSPLPVPLRSPPFSPQPFSRCTPYSTPHWARIFLPLLGEPSLDAFVRFASPDVAAARPRPRPPPHGLSGPGNVGPAPGGFEDRAAYERKSKLLR